ncbi:unnamed protein product [Citrullus colocynthis]|uniref:Uncharacterized protein n=1 Tax=Citrullus colocynthis TaxID=252529 RepID=A0ABP0Y429_9ROSI
MKKGDQSVAMYESLLGSLTLHQVSWMQKIESKFICDGSKTRDSRANQQGNVSKRPLCKHCSRRHQGSVKPKAKYATLVKVGAILLHSATKGAMEQHQAIGCNNDSTTYRGKATSTARKSFRHHSG